MDSPSQSTIRMDGFPHAARAMRSSHLSAPRLGLCRDDAGRNPESLEAADWGRAAASVASTCDDDGTAGGFAVSSFILQFFSVQRFAWNGAPTERLPLKNRKHFETTRPPGECQTIRCTAAGKSGFPPKSQVGY